MRDHDASTVASTWRRAQSGLLALSAASAFPSLLLPHLLRRAWRGYNGHVRRDLRTYLTALLLQEPLPRALSPSSCLSQFGHSTLRRCAVKPIDADQLVGGGSCRPSPDGAGAGRQESARRTYGKAQRQSTRQATRPSSCIGACRGLCRRATSVTSRQADRTPRRHRDAFGRCFRRLAVSGCSTA